MASRLTTVFFSLTSVCLPALVSAQGEFPASTAYNVFEHDSRWYHAVHVDLNSVDVTPTAHYNSRLRGFWSAAGKSQPVAAITGTFFAFENQQPVADVVIDGVQKAKGYRGSVLAVDWYGQAKIFDVPTREQADYSSYRYALRGMIRVVNNGEVKPNPQAQGFRDRRIWGRAPRTAIGITPENKMVMVATTQNVTLSQLGKAMKSQNVIDGVALDGGNSTFLYYMGEVKVNYGRPQSTLFMIEKRSPFDDVFKKRFQSNNLQALLAPKRF